MLRLRIATTGELGHGRLRHGCGSSKASSSYGDDFNRPDEWPAHIITAKRQRLHEALRENLLENLLALRDASVPKEPKRKSKTV